MFKQDEPPLWNYNRILIIYIIFTILFIAGFIYSAQRWAKEPAAGIEEVSLERCFLRANIEPPQPKVKFYTLGVLTAYNPVEEQCDSTPHITASGERVREGIIANNCWKFGTPVEIDGEYYKVQDRMNKRYGCEYWDILMWDYQEAREFGKQIKEVKILE